jgi:hypothetical protein
LSNAQISFCKVEQYPQCSQFYLNVKRAQRARSNEQETRSNEQCCCLGAVSGKQRKGKREK